jgi:hypothetical protein
MIKNIVLAMSILVSPLIYAKNLDHLFDLTLGTQVDEKKSNFISNDKNIGLATYRIIFNGFYGVGTYYTPITNKIYSIVTTKFSNQDCQYEAAMIAGTLTNTYGMFENVKNKGTDIVYMKSEGSKSIMIGCSGSEKPILKIVLVDTKLHELYLKEKASLGK